MSTSTEFLAQSNSSNPTTLQLRAARALIGMTQEEIGRRAGVSAKTVINVEARKCSMAALGAVVNAYRRMGIVFEVNHDYSQQSVFRTFEGPQPIPSLLNEPG